MAENSFGWDNWTGTGVNDADSLAAEIDRIKKWQRAHTGIDFSAAGPDYPHPSQRVRTLYFYQGNGRIAANGFEVIGPLDATSVPGIRWVPEFSDVGEPTIYPYVTQFANLEESPASEYAALLSIAANASSSKQSSIQVGSITDGSSGVGIAHSVILRVRDTGSGYTGTVTLSYNDATTSGNLALSNVPLYLIGVASDYANLSDGMLWYRSDTDKFRARANGVTENLAFESSIPTTMNKQPYAAKTTTYTTTASDGVITVDATSASFTVTLVASSGNAGLTQTFKKINAANVVTIDGNSSETIDGLTTYALSAQWSWVTLVCTGSSWIVTGAG